MSKWDFRVPRVVFGMAVDGWIKSAEGDLILWANPDHNKFLQWDPRRRLTIPNAKVSIDVEDFIHGPDWWKCYKGPSPVGA